MLKRELPAVEAFQYPATALPQECPWYGIPEIGDLSAKSEAISPRMSTASGGDHDSNRPSGAAVQEIEHSFEAGREQGIREGRKAQYEEQHEKLQIEERKRMEQAAQLSERFAEERDRFLQAIEHAVVKLALAIAARIMRREAQMDPLFLIGAVRVALGQLAESVKVRVRVPAPEGALWTETLAHMPRMKLKPTVVAEEGLEPGDCIIETELGSVDLGMRAQLSEAERACFAGERNLTQQNGLNYAERKEGDERNP